MPIRPIDLQVILPKSQSNPNNREHVVNKEAIALQQTQMANKRQSIEMDKKVNALKQKDGHKVEAKKENDQNQGKKKQAGQDKPQAKPSTSKEPTKEEKPSQGKKTVSFNRFDMKV